MFLCQLAGHWQRPGSRPSLASRIPWLAANPANLVVQ